MFILNGVETSHILISNRLYFILTILITEDGPQPSILSDCNFSSSAGEVSGTQAGLWGGVGGEPVHRYGTRRAKKGHMHLWRAPLTFYFDFFNIIFFVFSTQIHNFERSFSLSSGPKSCIVPPCKISLGGPGTKCWQIITFCNGPAGSPSGNFSPGIISYFVYSTGQ
jgi:hypothetical protein